MCGKRNESLSCRLHCSLPFTSIYRGTEKERNNKERINTKKSFTRYFTTERCTLYGFRRKGSSRYSFLPFVCSINRLDGDKLFSLDDDEEDMFWNQI